MPRKPAKPKRVTLAHLPRALQDLGINRPYYSARVVGNRIELHLYGGDVVYWPPKAPSNPPQPEE